MRWAKHPKRIEIPEGIGGAADAAPGPGMAPAYWSPVRLELREWFRRHAPSLGELYEGAVGLMFGPPLAGRVRFVTHAMREVGNRLPDVMAGRRGDATFQYKGRLDNLSTIWAAAGYSFDGSVPASITAGVGTAVPPGPNLQINRKLFEEIAKLVRDHVATREKPEDAAFRMFQAVAPENRAAREELRPVLKQWVQILKWAASKVHDSGRVDAECCTREELERQFELFEMTVGTLVRGYFKTVDALDEILEDANS